MEFSNHTRAHPLKYVFSGKPLIAPEPEVGKFQNWVEMKVNNPTNKKNTHKDFSDNFHSIENFVQVEHPKEKFKKPPLFFVFPLQEDRRWSEKISKWQK